MVSIIWLWGTLFIAGFFPIIDGRRQILAIFKAIRKGGSSEKTGIASPTDGEVSSSDSTKGGVVAAVPTLL